MPASHCVSAVGKGFGNRDDFQDLSYVGTVFGNSPFLGTIDIPAFPSYALPPFVNYDGQGGRFESWEVVWKLAWKLDLSLWFSGC